MSHANSLFTDVDCLANCGPTGVRDLVKQDDLQFSPGYALNTPDLIVCVAAAIINVFQGGGKIK
jgi:hypothetical protein